MKTALFSLIYFISFGVLSAHAETLWNYDVLGFSKRTQAPVLLLSTTTEDARSTYVQLLTMDRNSISGAGFSLLSLNEQFGLYTESQLRGHALSLAKPILKTLALDAKDKGAEWKVVAESPREYSLWDRAGKKNLSLFVSMSPRRSQALVDVSVTFSDGQGKTFSLQREAFLPTTIKLSKALQFHAGKLLVFQLLSHKPQVNKFSFLFIPE